MGQQIKFFEKNYIDYNNENAAITVVDTQSTDNGQTIVEFLQSRKNSNAWVTSGSLDSYNTTLEVFLGGAYRVQDILLVGHNFKNYSLDYDDAGVWVDIETVTSNTDATTHHNMSEVVTSKIRIVITGTMIADENKRMKQLIISRPFNAGQLEGWPVIKPVLDQNKKVTEMLSGKVNIAQSLGGYTIDLSIKSCESESDLELFEEMYQRFNEGFLIWCNAGDNAQFKSNRSFWKGEDIFLVKPVDSYTAEWFQGIYSAGMPIKTRLKEVIR